MAHFCGNVLEHIEIEMHELSQDSHRVPRCERHFINMRLGAVVIDVAHAVGLKWS